MLDLLCYMYITDTEKVAVLCRSNARYSKAILVPVMFLPPACSHGCGSLKSKRSPTYK